jgi:hypothetical protein
MKKEGLKEKVFFFKVPCTNASTSSSAELCLWSKQFGNSFPFCTEYQHLVLFKLNV